MTKRVVFMGTPDFAVPSLRALLHAEDFEVVGVVTQPDRPAGRGNRLRQSPVKVVAMEHQVELFQPEKLRGEAVIAHLQNWQPDLHVVAAYGQILRPVVLDLPPYGSINVHASLLPRWRGAAPIQYAILAGDDTTGITIMQMDPGLDSGPILSQESIPIASDETGESLHDKLAAIAGPLLVDTLRGFISGAIKPQTQDESLVTKAPSIKKEQGAIDWTKPADYIERQVRAYHPWPGTFTYWDGDLLKIFGGRVVAGKLKPGQVFCSHAEAPLVIGTGEGGFAPAQLQLAGRKAMDVSDFVNGFAQIDGVVLGE